MNKEMLFHDLSFILFCALVFAIYWRTPRARLWVLAFANALFYLAAGWQNLGLFLGASALTFALGRVVTGPFGRWALGLGVAANVANLAFFKYAGFVTTSLFPALQLPFLDPALVKDVLLPIGISFYTFQHISYLVDRRVRDLPEAPSYLHFWVYISFFGHSIAGPIMRGHEFFPQIAETKRLRLDAGTLSAGLTLFGVGLLKKVAIADHLAKRVDFIYNTPWTMTAGDAWSGALLFAFQIYYDFSAYSDMAVGIGLLFGYTLRQNFRTPYVAANAGEFWRRWHVTLSEWIRDYVYIPLGGNRAGAARSQLNLFLAMLVSGLWHGAAWTFVFWGAWHGVLLLGQRVWGGAKSRLGWAFFDGRLYHGLAVAAFFLLTTIGWVLFRATGLEEAAWMLATMFDVRQWGSLAAAKGTILLATGLYGLHVAEYVLRRDDNRLARRVVALTPAPVRGLVAAAMVSAFMVGYGDAQQFIYFQF